VARRHRQHQHGADTGSLDRLSEQTGTKQFHIEFPIQIDALIEDTSRHIKDLVSPQIVRFK
jgi:hypothetical protein